MNFTRILNEGVDHLEDLPIDQFLEVVANLSSMTGQEKLDGANLWIGVDDDGQFFASREGKRNNAERKYKPDEWPLVSANNQFRAAHAAMLTKEQEIKRVMRTGDTVEVEVLFGRQPNSVTYGADDKSYIAFLRGVNDTPDEIADHLSQSLVNQQAQAKVEIIDTSDGQNLETRNVDITFQFISPSKIDTAKLAAESGVDPELKKLESFLNAESSMPGKTNLELSQLNLTSVQTDQRVAAKKMKADVLAQIMTQFKLPIKNALLVKSSGKSSLAAKDIKPDEDVGIEGIVLRDPNTGKQVKVVDKDVFTAINRFNQSMRGEVQSSLNTTDPDAPLESRGGLVGQLRIRIADTLGNRELAKPANVRKIMAPIKGDSATAAIKNLAKSLTAAEDFEGIKKKILAMTSETYKELAEKLAWFKENKQNYRLKLKSGKEIGLSDETVKKTLLTFAEARRNLGEQYEKMKACTTLEQLLAVLYGPSANAVHNQVQESLLFEKRKPKKSRKGTSIATGEISVTEFKGKNTLHLVNAYMATVFMTMVLFKADDKPGLKLAHDAKNYLLTKHNADMSPMNHWGTVIWRHKDFKLEPAAQLALGKVTKEIPTPWWKNLHFDFSKNNEVVIRWKEHAKTLRQLMDLSGVRSDRLNTLLDLSLRFDKLDVDEQRSALKKLIAFAHLFVSRSKLIPRLKFIEKHLKEPMAEGLLRTLAALVEDDGGSAPDGGGGFEVGQTSNGAPGGTTAASIGSNPQRLFGGKRKTELRRRDPEAIARVKKMKLKFKDPRRHTETEQ